MIVATNITVSKEVNNLSGKAQSALAQGDTQRAQKLHEDAGKLLEREAAWRRATGEQNLMRFLAATQYYKGGMYPKAAKLGQKIQQQLLPTEYRSILAKFRNDLKKRSNSNYQSRIRRLLKESFQKRQFEKVIEILQEHPYILPPAHMAFSRANCCERLGDYKTAALFYADITKYDPDGLEFSLYSAATPLTLISTDLAKAWETVETHLDKLPHVLTFVAASLIRFAQASGMSAGKKRERIFEEQISYYRESWQKYKELPSHLQKRDDILNAVLNCFEASALTFWRRNEDELAVEVCNQAIAMASTTPGVWTMRGMVSYPGGSSVSDFEKAVQLGDDQYYPFYYLAHASLMRDDFGGAASWCEKALQHHSSPAIEDQLRKWLAITQNPKKVSPTNSRSKKTAPKLKNFSYGALDSNRRKGRSNSNHNFLLNGKYPAELSRNRDDSVLEVVARA